MHSIAEASASGLGSRVIEDGWRPKPGNWSGDERVEDDISEEATCRKRSRGMSPPSGGLPVGDSAMKQKEVMHELPLG